MTCLTVVKPNLSFALMDITTSGLCVLHSALVGSPVQRTCTRLTPRVASAVSTELAALGHMDRIRFKGLHANVSVGRAVEMLHSECEVIVRAKAGIACDLVAGAAHISRKTQYCL